jgi:hypothetical protein
MKYKVGDRVILFRIGGDYSTKTTLLLEDNNYTFTIKYVGIITYELQGLKGVWSESSIQGLYKEPVYEIINNRFEILDL